LFSFQTPIYDCVACLLTFLPSYTLSTLNPSALPAKDVLNLVDNALATLASTMLTVFFWNPKRFPFFSSTRYAGKDEEQFLLDSGIANGTDPEVATQYGFGPCLHVPALDKAAVVNGLPFNLDPIPARVGVWLTLNINPIPARVGVCGIP
jgi:hypothetical protein